MEGSKRPHPRDLVSSLENYLHKSPHAWPTDSRSDKSLRYRIGQFLLLIEFSDSEHYNLKVSKNGSEINETKDLPYYLENGPDWTKFFEENVKVARRLTDCK